jgi:hypothetical protein
MGAGNIFGLRTVNLSDTATFRVFARRWRTSKLATMNQPQQLSREAIDDFRAIYQDEFGVTLTDDEVQEIAMRLLHLFGILVQPGSHSE